MKRVLLPAIVLLAGLTACNNGTAESGKTENGKAAEAPKASALDASTPKFKKLWQTDDGDFRGISLGDTAGAVKKKESAKLTDEMDGSISYKLEYSADDYANIDYYFDGENGKLYQIFVTYEQMDKNEMIAPMVDYLTKRYGQPVKNEGKYTWTQQNKTITLETSVNAGWERADMYIESKE